MRDGKYVSLFLGGLVALSVLAATADEASACSCRRVSQADAMGRADIVFEGEATDARLAGGRKRETTFRVDRVVKGEVGETVRIVTNRQSATCGVDFYQSNYGPLIAATRGDDGRYRTNSCLMWNINRK
ncbi:hypothetical protein GGD81_000175 [Rhodobium orientis]|uniref:Tissue inhibitor of metalloproteinase n=1 Tax=Rhodobium orientis TaxID=34017 RepID=A0A327K3V7_9HYPH|nr:hypothetical protein [Rhodobium orientis]MBB4301160.1 hypothetical protein [Rhodobium orientis]MBK5949829.1 hypothetical protein [Rhodobium orientis]RAI30068.1 hypothetical protein CH339_00615 [Rhodobium orientis]